MKLNKKLKYFLGSVGLVGIAIIPVSVGLVSCSKKEEADNIVYYQDAQGAIFEGQVMAEGSYPFKCDFNLTKKTCAIVDWTTNEPNYMTEGLPLRDGLGSESLHNKNNTIRIPSQIIYNGVEFSVVAFATFKGSTNNTYKLDLNKIDNYLIQVIEFDVGLTEINRELSINNSGAYINFEAIRQPNLLKVLNYPQIGMDLSGSKKLNEITFNPKKASYPGLENCISLTNIDIPPVGTSDGRFVGGFKGCTSLKTVTIAEGATEISAQAFKGCTSLIDITIPNSVTSIKDSAFEDCSSLANITIPNSVTSIGESAFKGTKNLSWQIIPKKIYENKISGGYFDGLDMKGFEIPNSVTIIGGFAFKGSLNFTNITIPNSVTSIDNFAFYSCSDLENITIPNSVTSIGDYVFQRCRSLTNVNILDGVTGIGDFAFDSCSSLTNITIPNSVTIIGNAAFQYSSSLTNITIPDTITSIGWSTFEGCSSLTNITIPDTVTSIGHYAFANCSSLESITIPKSVNEFDFDIFEGSHTSTFKIYFHSQQQLDLFLETNSDMSQYCEVLPN